MIEASHDPALEVDEPTQPFSRADIQRLREEAQRRQDVYEDEEWFELDGRRLRVSLAAFEYICLGTPPPGMIGAADASFACGAIVDDRVSALPRPVPPSPEADPPAPQEVTLSRELKVLSRDRKRIWVIALGLAAVVASATWAFVDTAWKVQARGEASTEALKTVNRGVTKEPPTPIVSPEPPSVEVEPPKADEPNRGVPSDKPASQTRACIERRDRAENARRNGDYELLEQVAGHHKCWTPESKAKELQMQALFELGRFDDCIRMGAKGGSKGMKKWASTCQRALEKSSLEP